MTDTIKVETQRGVKSLDLDGVRYPVEKGTATLPGFYRDQLSRVDNIVAGPFFSFSGTTVKELICTSCKRKKIANFGPVCAWCGGNCEAIN